MGPGSGRGKQTGTAAAGDCKRAGFWPNAYPRAPSRRAGAARHWLSSTPAMIRAEARYCEGRKTSCSRLTPNSGVNTGISLVQAAACPARAGASWPFPAMGWKMIFPTTYGTRSKTSRIPPGTRHGGGENCMLMRTAITTSSLARPDAAGRCAVASSSGRGRG